MSSKNKKNIKTTIAKNLVGNERLYDIDPKTVKYAGFNLRLTANLIDTVVLLVVSLPLMLYSMQFAATEESKFIEILVNDWLYNKISDQQFFQVFIPKLIEQIPIILTKFAISFVIFGAIFIGFWKWKNSTPGKLLLRNIIVDNETFEAPTTKQYILRFFGYILSALPFGMGFFMIGLNKKKRGLHDFIAGTVVVNLAAQDPSYDKKMMKFKTYVFVITLVIFVIMLATR